MHENPDPESPVAPTIEGVAPAQDPSTEPAPPPPNITTCASNQATIPATARDSNSSSPISSSTLSPSSSTPSEKPPTSKRGEKQTRQVSLPKILWPSWTSKPRPQDSRLKEAQWGIHWYMPFCMISLTIFGIASMIGHHFYNHKLHGQEVHDPQWPQRYGLALSTFGKLCLAGAVEIAYKQQVWTAVKKRDFQLTTINGIFSACNDPLEFLNLELLLKATMMTLLAGIIWTLPLCVLVSPATLTSVASIQSTSTICDGIQIIEFIHDNTANISAPSGSIVENDGRQGLAYIDLQLSNNSIAYYAGPSMNLQRISTLSLLSNFGPLQASNPCRGGANCSYDISFKGPSYKCDEAPVADANTISAKARLAPNGEAIYTSFSDVEEDNVGAPVEWQYMTAKNDSTIGLFTKEPTLWIGYVINTTLPKTPFDPTAAWPYVLEQHVMQCILQNATYDYSISFLNGLMNIISSRVSHDIPLLPIGQSKHPLDENYGDFMGYHAAGYIFRSLLSGTVNQTDASRWTRSYSSISQTPLLNQTSQYAISSFPHAIEQQFAYQILSLSTTPVLYAQINITAPCTSSTTVLRWNYKPFWLVLSYSLAGAATLLAVGLGWRALLENGYVADTGFCTVLCTTRNEDLRRVGEGACLGQEPLGREVRETRVRFGDVGASADGVGRHAAFGLRGEVRPIVGGGKYV